MHLSAGARGFQARVEDRILGAAASHEFSEPLPQAELETWSAAPRPLLTVTPVAGGRSEERARDLGRRLFDAVFHGPILESWGVHRDRARREGRVLRLRLRIASGALERWPWELLCDSRGNYLAQAEDLSVVRDADADHPAEGVETRGPLRLLLVTAQPEGFEDLDADREGEHLRAALAPLEEGGTIEIRELRQPTLAALQAALAGVSILHFIGHGGVDDRGLGQVVLMDSEGGADWVDGHRLSTVLHESAKLQMVVLNSCEGTRGFASERFVGIAQTLSRYGIQAVLAMQFEISSGAATSFAQHFYSSLADGLGLERSITLTRRRMHVESGESEWASPVLFLRSVRAARTGFLGRPLDAWRKLREQPGRSAAILLGLALFTAGILHYESLAELGWRVERRASEPQASRTAPALPFDPFLRCPDLGGTGIKLVPIPAGELIPADPIGSRRSSPPWRVKITPFCIAKTEISQRQWRVIAGSNPSQVRGDDLPANGVSSGQSQEFLAKLNLKYPEARCSLPTAFQFEYVASVGDGRPYGFHGPESLARYYANCNENRDGFDGLAPVDEFLPNEWGVSGLVGNAAEWVIRSPLPTSLGADVSLPTAEPERMGGSYLNDSRSCRASAHAPPTETRHYRQNGFRIVCQPLPKPPH